MVIYVQNLTTELLATSPDLPPKRPINARLTIHSNANANAISQIRNNLVATNHQHTALRFTRSLLLILWLSLGIETQSVQLSYQLINLDDLGELLW